MDESAIAPPASAWRVCKSSELEERGRRVVEAGEVTVGVFRIDGGLYAYENLCAHMGGPVCQGLVVPAVVERLNERRQLIGSDFDTSDIHVVCPWHGFEYSIKRGHHATQAHIRLKAVRVDEREGEIHVYL